MFLLSGYTSSRGEMATFVCLKTAKTSANKKYVFAFVTNIVLTVLSIKSWQQRNAFPFVDSSGAVLNFLRTNCIWQVSLIKISENKFSAKSSRILDQPAYLSSQYNLWKIRNTFYSSEILATEFSVSHYPNTLTLYNV